MNQNNFLNKSIRDTIRLQQECQRLITPELVSRLEQTRPYFELLEPFWDSLNKQQEMINKYQPILDNVVKIMPENIFARSMAAASLAHDGPFSTAFKGTFFQSFEAIRLAEVCCPHRVHRSESKYSRIMNADVSLSQNDKDLLEDITEHLITENTSIYNEIFNKSVSNTSKKSNRKAQLAKAHKITLISKVSQIKRNLSDDYLEKCIMLNNALCEITTPTNIFIMIQMFGILWAVTSDLKSKHVIEFLIGYLITMWIILMLTEKH